MDGKSSRGFRFLHCGDLCLDRPCAGLRELTPDVAALLRAAPFRALDNVIDTAVHRQVDLILIAGDVYGVPEPSLTAQLRFRDALDRAAAAGIAWCLAHGRDDPCGPGGVWLPVPPNSYRFPVGKVDRRTIRRGRRPLVEVLGTSHASGDLVESPSLHFRRAGSAPCAIGVLPFPVQDGGRRAGRAASEVNDLVAADLDYWAAGRGHCGQVIRPSAPTVVAAGGVQGRGADEPGPHGCFLVTVDEGGGFHPEFVAADAIRWFDRTIDVAPLDRPDSLQESLGHVREEIRSAAAGRPALVRLRLIGAGPLHEDLRREEVVSGLKGQFNEALPSRDDPVWLTSLEIRTSPSVDLNDRIRADDFVGEFLRTARALRRRQDGPLAVRQMLLDRPAHAGVRQEIDAFSDVQLRELLDEAESLGLDELLAETQ